MTKDSKLSSLEKVKVFLVWFRLALPLRAIARLFWCSTTPILDAISELIKLLDKQFVPHHLGFGPLHKFNGEKVTRDLVHSELSTWISQKIGQKVFKTNMSGVADGTYIYIMNFGGFEGNKMLYSGQKKRTLSKVQK